MNCLDCKYARWYKTKNGRMHQSGDGTCQWKYPVIVLPVAFYFWQWSGKMPEPSGGFINRHKLRECPAAEAIEIKAETNE